jgi:hypothetical protein
MTILEERRAITLGSTVKAKCVEAIDLGMVNTEWGLKWRIKLMFETTEARNQYGDPIRLARTYNSSLHEKSALRRDLESWLGKEFADKAARDGFDTETLVGRVGQLRLETHPNRNGDDVYYSIAGIN